MPIPGTAYRSNGVSFASPFKETCTCAICLREVRAMRDGFVLGYLTAGGKSDDLDVALRAAGFEPIHDACVPAPVAVAPSPYGTPASASAGRATPRT